MRWLLLASLMVPALFGQDEAAIKGVVAKYVDAREKRDAAAIEALFTRDADQLVSSGEWRKGREAVVKGTMASSEAIAPSPSRRSDFSRPTWRSPTAVMRSRAPVAPRRGRCGRPS